MESWGQNTGWRGRREEREGRRPAIFIQLHKRNSHLRKGFPSPPCHVNPRLAAIFNACPRYARSLKGVFLSQERCRPYLSLSLFFSRRSTLGVLEDLAIPPGRWIANGFHRKFLLIRVFQPENSTGESLRISEFEAVRDVVTQDDLKSEVVDRKDLKVLNLEKFLKKPKRIEENKKEI